MPDINRDKALLESEINRLGCENFLKVEFSSDPLDSEGLKLVQSNVHNGWFTVNLSITQTLANWRQLLDNAGELKTWEVVADDDYNPHLGKNTGVEWSDD